MAEINRTGLSWAQEISADIAYRSSARDIELPAIVFANIIDRADIRMIQGRRGACFTQKAFASGSIAADVLGKKLLRDMASQACIFGFVKPRPSRRSRDYR